MYFASWIRRIERDCELQVRDCRREERGAILRLRAEAREADHAEQARRHATSSSGSASRATIASSRACASLRSRAISGSDTETPRPSRRASRTERTARRSSTSSSVPMSETARSPGGSWWRLCQCPTRSGEMRYWTSPCAERFPGSRDVERKKPERQRNYETEDRPDARERAARRARAGSRDAIGIPRGAEAQSDRQAARARPGTKSASAPSMSSDVGISTPAVPVSGSAASGDCCCKTGDRVLFEEPLEETQRLTRRRERCDAEPDSRTVDLGDRARERRDVVRRGLQIAHEQDRPRQPPRRARASTWRDRPQRRYACQHETTASTGSAPIPAAVPRAGGGTDEAHRRTSPAEGARTARPRRRRARWRPPRRRAAEASAGSSRSSRR